MEFWLNMAKKSEDNGSDVLLRKAILILSIVIFAVFGPNEFAEANKAYSFQEECEYYLNNLVVRISDNEVGTVLGFLENASFSGKPFIKIKVASNSYCFCQNPTEEELKKDFLSTQAEGRLIDWSFEEYKRWFGAIHTMGISCCSEEEKFTTITIPFGQFKDNWTKYDGSLNSFQGK